jgi:hypothetical protein
MPEKRGPARKTRTQARDSFLQLASQLWDEFNTWYDVHPEATFDEMEQELGRRRRAFMGEILALTLRREDLGALPEAPACEQCGQRMEFKGYPDKAVHGLEADANIPRAYYVCSTCGSGLFPPGATSPPAPG